MLTLPLDDEWEGAGRTALRTLPISWNGTLYRAIEAVWWDATTQRMNLGPFSLGGVRLQVSGNGVALKVTESILVRQK